MVAAIREALLALLDEGRELETETLTVSELAARAGVTRKTFYARCGSIEGVVSGIACDLFAEAPETVADLVDTLLATGLERLLLGPDAPG